MFAKHLKKLMLMLAIALISISYSETQATVLTFESLGLPVYGNISSNYGDNVSSSSDASGSYLEGNGFTPNIALDYRSLSVGGGSGGTLYTHLDFWSSGYGDLFNVAYPVNPVSTGEISFVPDSGFSVVLNSFDLAGWAGANRLNQPLRIYDENYNILSDFTPFDVVGVGHNSVSLSLVHNGIVRIQYGNTWNVGIDNINFDQIANPSGAPVPEPGTLVLMGSGLLGLVGYNIRRRKQM